MDKFFIKPPQGEALDVRNLIEPTELIPRALRAMGKDDKNPTMDDIFQAIDKIMREDK
jgi:hypothetical protein